MHLIIDHSAELTDLQGPMGFWSQQSFEASHKLTKSNYSRSTMHGGGKITKGLRQLKRASSPAYQMLVKHVRMFISNIRLSIQKSTCCPEGYDSIIQAEYGESNEELKHAEETRNRDKERIKRRLGVLFTKGEKLQRQRRADLNTPSPARAAPLFVTPSSSQSPVAAVGASSVFVTPSSSPMVAVDANAANVTPCSVDKDGESTSNCGGSGGGGKRTMMSMLNTSFDDLVMSKQESLVTQSTFGTAVKLGVVIGSEREDEDNDAWV